MSGPIDKGKKRSLDEGQGEEQALVGAISVKKCASRGNADSGGPCREAITEFSTQGAESMDPEGKKKRRRKRKKRPDEEGRPRAQIRKLVPPRPFPTVDPASSATGPRSSHVEGKNRLCVSRKTPLGMYLRRCKELILKDGYKTLYLCAMGAAISHCNRLAVSLPSILPHSRDAIQTEMTNGTVEVRDEMIPDDCNEDIYIQKRVKATLNVIIKIDGGDEDSLSVPERKKRVRRGRKQRSPPTKVVFKEMDVDELEDAIVE